MKTYPDPVISVGTGKGNDPALVHVPEDQRAYVGKRIAEFVDYAIRDAAQAAGRHKGRTSRDPLCPGCTMSVMINALIELSRANDWPFEYVAAHMSRALQELHFEGITAADQAIRGPAYDGPRLGANLGDPEGLRSVDELGTAPEACEPLRTYSGACLPAYKNLRPSDALQQLKASQADALGLGAVVRDLERGHRYVHD